MAGIITRYSNGIVPDIIARGVARFLIRHTRSSISLLETFPVWEIGGRTLHSLRENLDLRSRNPFDLSYQQVKENLLRGVTTEDTEDEEIRAAILEFTRIDTENNLQPLGRKLMSLREDMSVANIGNWLGAIGRMIDWVFSKMEVGFNYLRWFHFMQNSEHSILQHLRKDEPGIQRFVFHMMDVDNYFDYASDFDFQTVQVPKMKKLLDENPRELIGFVAFDPKRNDAMEIIEDAILNQGFTGIKFYPPLGYKPIGNPKAIQDKIDALYAFCLQHDTPIFAHCNNQGFEADRRNHSGYNSNPLHWQEVLKLYPKLRLCLAHAGGVEGWFSKLKPIDEIDPPSINDNAVSDSDQKDWNSSYAKVVYKLCLNFENVYCDAAYLDEVTDEEYYKNFRERLIYLFNQKPKFAEKIIYGSDWHMLFQEGKNKRYFSDYLRLFSEQDLKAKRDIFFEKNALQYLKIQ